MRGTIHCRLSLSQDAPGLRVLYLSAVGVASGFSLGRMWLPSNSARAFERRTQPSG